MNDRLSVSPEMAILLASLVVQGKRFLVLSSKLLID